MRNIIIYVYSYFYSCVYSPIASFSLNRDNERGATMVEYAILVALISVAAITIIVTLGGQIQAAFTSVTTAIADNTGT
jgi:pilus assembly protein Flp/PilA